MCKPELTHSQCYEMDGDVIIGHKFVEVDKDNLVCKDRSNMPTEPFDLQDPNILKEAKKSFFSGHAQLCFYTATFLVVYLHVRLAPASVRKHVGRPSPEASNVVRCKLHSADFFPHFSCQFVVQLICR